MQPMLKRLSQSTVVCLTAALSLLVVGALLLTMESWIQGFLGVNAAPWGASFVVLGAIVGLYGFWSYWPYLEPRAGLRIAGALMAFGLALLLLAIYTDSESVLLCVVAFAALLSSLQGAMNYLGGFFPNLRHDGVMSLREKAAVFSLAANGLLAIYLFGKSQALGEGFALAYGGVTSSVATTVATVVGVLIAESVIAAFLRRSKETATLEDERDAEIRQKARCIGHAVLVAAVLLLVIQLGIGSAIEPIRSPNEVLGLSSSLAIAHALLALIFLSQGSRSAAELWQYRRARF